MAIVNAWFRRPQVRGDKVKTLNVYVQNIDTGTPFGSASERAAIRKHCPKDPEGGWRLEGYVYVDGDYHSHCHHAKSPTV